MNNLPIRYKLISLLLLISILPSIGLGLLTNWAANRIIENQVTDTTLQLIGQVNKTLEFYADNLQNISYLISFNRDVKDFLWETGAHDNETNDHYEIKQFLQGFTTLYSEVAGILVVNKDGQYISNEMYARSPKNLTQESWYQEAVKNKGLLTFLGHPTNRNITNQVNYKNSEVVSVVRAILDPDTEEVKGVVLIDLKLRVIAEATKNVRLGKSGYLMVNDDKGGSIYSPPNSVVNHFPKGWLGKKDSGTFSKIVNGKKLQFMYQSSSFTNWITIGVFSNDESAMEVREIDFYVACFVFFVCFLGITASYYLSDSMSRPIGQLMFFMKKVESGDLSIRYKGERKDEIGMLGQSFNKMLIQINRLISLTELQERQKREAELRSLQAHIKPHFLYNTLDTINWMARKQGADDVASVVESLSRLFRIGLSKGNDIIPLKDEIEHIKSYLLIQKARYKDKMNYMISVNINIEDMDVLKLVLQPIVENAIYHGIKERRGPGHIVIDIAEDHDFLVLSVTDDGRGIEAEILQSLRTKLESTIIEDEKNKKVKDIGYGMMNVQSRIKLTFGNHYGLQIESELGKGTTVKAFLPIIRGESLIERT